MPADQDNINQAFHLITQHSQVQTYEGRAMHRIFRLAAGTAYTVALVLGGGDAGTWSYYAASTHLWLEAKAWAQ